MLSEQNKSIVLPLQRKDGEPLSVGKKFGMNWHRISSFILQLV